MAQHARRPNQKLTAALPVVLGLLVALALLLANFGTPLERASFGDPRGLHAFSSDPHWLPPSDNGAPDPRSGASMPSVNPGVRVRLLNSRGSPLPGRFVGIRSPKAMAPWRWNLTDAAGTVAFDDPAIPADVHYAVASELGHYVIVSRSREVELTGATGACLGRVALADGGRPVSGARAVLAYVSGGRTLFVSPSAALSGPDGSLEVEHLTTAAANISCESELGPGSVAPLAAGFQLTVDARRQVEVHGVVRDRVTGAGVGYAMIQVGSDFTDGRSRKRLSTEVQARANGTFSLRSYAGEVARLYVGAPGYAVDFSTAIEFGSVRVVEVSLAPSRQVRGLVLDSRGRGLAGWSVAPVPSPPPGAPEWACALATSNAHGSFTLDGAPSGQFELVAHRAGRDTRAVVADGVEEVELRLSMGDPLTIRLDSTDPTIKVGDCMVFLVELERTLESGGICAEEGPDDATRVAERMRDQRLRAVVLCPGHDLPVAWTGELEQGVPFVNIVVDHAHTRRVLMIGRVVDGNGGAVAGAHVRFVRPGIEEQRSVGGATGPDGRFQVEGVPASGVVMVVSNAAAETRVPLDNSVVSNACALGDVMLR